MKSIITSLFIVLGLFLIACDDHENQYSGKLLQAYMNENCEYGTMRCNNGTLERCTGEWSPIKFCGIVGKSCSVETIDCGGENGKTGCCLY
jgi:hypothetical protein